MPLPRRPRRAHLGAAVALCLAALLVLPAGAPAAEPAATLPPLPPLPPLPACSVRNHRTMATYPALAPAVSAARSGDTLDIFGGCTGTAVTLDRNLILRGYPVQSLRLGWLVGTKGAPILRIAPGKTVTIDALRLTHGRHRKATDGGAITNAGTLTIEGSTIRGNIGVYGGAIQTSGPVTVTGSSRFVRNAAFELGGAFAILPGGSVTLNGRSVVRSNWAGNGGGAWVQGTLTMNGPTAFTANRAFRPATSSWESSVPFVGYGGAIFLQGTLVMGANARIVENTALTRAGGIWWSNLTPIADYCTAPRTHMNEVALVEKDCESGTEAPPPL